jgi:CIC family chloride channel protein
MGAILGGTMRSPLTSIVFAFELTHDANVFLPLLVASVVAHAFTVLTLKRSILTEKVARRGYHLSREYAVDPLELLYVREVMNISFGAVPESMAAEQVVNSPNWRFYELQRILPVVGENDQLLGILTPEEVVRMAQDRAAGSRAKPLGSLLPTNGLRAYADETLRVIVYRMAQSGITELPVTERHSKKLVGLVSLASLLKARTKHLEEEKRREQVLRWRSFASP